MVERVAEISVLTSIILLVIYIFTRRLDVELLYITSVITGAITLNYIAWIK